MSLKDWLRGRRPDPDRDDRPPLPESAGEPAGQVDPDTGGILRERTPRRVVRPGEAGASAASAPEAADAAEPAGEVAGERTIPSVNRERSVQARISNALALGAILLLGGGFLAWYYSTQFARVREARETAAKAAEARTSAEMKVPPLGQINPPAPPTSSAGTVTVATTDVFGPAPPPPPQAATGPGTPPGGQPPPKTPEQLALERQLHEPVVRRGQPAAGAMPAAAPPPGLAPPGPNLAAVAGGLPGGMPGRASGEPGGTALAGLLQPTSTPAVEAQVVPTRRFLLPKGAFVDCTLETAIDSTYDGMVTCIGATDVYGADGKVVLLERGTKYIGEKRGEVRSGQARVFVLWSEARTPTGVVARLDSPGTDELGRTGLPGHVNTHFWERFGAAILISVVDGALRALATSQGSGTTVQLNPTGSRDVMTEILRNTISIPPTVIKNQGERIQVLVARDVDFRPVYALRTSAAN